MQAQTQTQTENGMWLPSGWKIENSHISNILFGTWRRRLQASKPTKKSDDIEANRPSASLSRERLCGQTFPTPCSAPDLNKSRQLSTKIVLSIFFSLLQLSSFVN